MVLMSVGHVCTLSYAYTHAHMHPDARTPCVQRLYPARHEGNTHLIAISKCLRRSQPAAMLLVQTRDDSETVNSTITSSCMSTLHTAMIWRLSSVGGGGCAGGCLPNFSDPASFRAAVTASRTGTTTLPDYSRVLSAVCCRRLARCTTACHTKYAAGVAASHRVHVVSPHFRANRQLSCRENHRLLLGSRIGPWTREPCVTTRDT